MEHRREKENENIIEYKKYILHWITQNPILKYALGSHWRMSVRTFSVHL